MGGLVAPAEKLRRFPTTPGELPGFVCPEVPPLKILVTVKLVPDTNADKRIDPATKRLVRTGVETVLNPFDEYAIEAALQLKEKLTTVPR